MIPVIVPTCRSNEKYCDALVVLMDRLWPEHPEIWFLSDSDGIRHPLRIKVDSSSWTEIVQRGLERLMQARPDMTHAYLILEDLFPLRACSAKRLERVEKVVLRESLKHVAFVPYEWGGEERRRFRDEIFYKVPKHFQYYSQLQPAIWDVHYLHALCRLALARGIHDPWKFEWLVTDEDHFVADYRWPSVFHGFLRQGRVNWPAIWKIKRPEGWELVCLLFRESIERLWKGKDGRFESA